jgi:hypothetical protein
MKNKLIIITAFLSLMLSQILTAQTHEVKIIAKVSKDKTKIKVRWAPSTAALLNDTKITGYRFQKFQITLNGKLLSVPISKKDTVFKIPKYSYQKGVDRVNWLSKFIEDSSMKAIALKDSLQMAADESETNTNDRNLGLLKKNKDNYALVWYALFGKSFQDDKTNSFTDGIVDISNEQDRRFNMVLTAADLDFELAKFIGLGWEDNIINNEKYLYKITPNTVKLSAKSSGVLIGKLDFEDLAKIPPYDLAVSLKDSVAHLNWNTSLLDKFYSGYNVYRSINTKPFVKLNETPIVKIGSDKETSVNYDDSLIDSTGNLNLSNTYNYKVSGIDPFGEEGRPSDIISSKVRLFVKNPPFITEIDFVSKKSYPFIAFEFDQKYISAWTKPLIIGRNF